MPRLRMPQPQWMYPLAADRTLGNVTQYSASAGGLGWLLASINALP